MLQSWQDCFSSNEIFNFYYDYFGDKTDNRLEMDYLLSFYYIMPQHFSILKNKNSAFVLYEAFIIWFHLKIL